MNGETGVQAGSISIRELSFPLYACEGWMKFVAVMSIISGALQVLTIFGIIIAWLPIWTGILLLQSANAVGQAYETDSKEALTVSLSKLKTYFIIMGILTLIGVIVMVLALSFGLLSVGLSALSLSQQ
jgi:hypothetical protein